MKVLSNKSYLILFDFDETLALKIQQYAIGAFFQTVNVKTIAELEQVAEDMNHSLGVLAFHDWNHDELVTTCLNLKLHVTFFTQDPNVKSTNMVSYWSDELSPATATTVVKKYLDNLVPQRLKEICLHTVNMIRKSFMPNYGAEFILSEPKTGLFDVFVSTECLAQGFYGRTFIKIDTNKAKSEGGDFLQNLSYQETLDYMAEFANQITGVINRYLLKFDVHARVSLPKILTDEESTQGLGRSDYYSPHCTVRDPKNIVQVRFSFLLPLLRASEYQFDFNRVVLQEDGDETVEILNTQHAPRS